MQNLEILNLQAVTVEEMNTINGGGFWSDFFDGLVDAIINE